MFNNQIYLNRNIILISLASLLAIMMVVNQQLIVRAQYNRHVSEDLASELRQSSENLTKYVKNYVLTGDEKYEEMFTSTLAINSGVQPRTDGKFIPLRVLLNSSGLTQTEQSFVNKANEKYDELVNLEIAAMEALKGKLKENTKKLIKANESNRDFVIRILSDKNYRAAQDNLIFYLNKFFKQIDKRTNDILMKYSYLNFICLLLFIFIIINLIKSMREDIKNQYLLSRVISAIRNEFDLDIVRKNIVETIGQTLNADRCLLRLYDESQSSFILLDENSEYRSSSDVKSIVGLELGNDTLDLSTKNAKDNLCIIEDFDKFLEGVDKSLRQKLYDLCQQKSLIIVFITYKSIKLATLELYFNKLTKFDGNYIKFIKSIADQAGVALYQSQIHKVEQERAKRESLLSEIISEIKHLSTISEILLVICEKLGNFYDTNNIIISIYNRQNDLVKFLKSSSEYTEKEPFYKLNSLIYKKYLAENHYIVKTDLASENGEEFKHINSKSIIAASIETSIKEELGIIIFSSKENTANEIDKMFLTRVLDHINYYIKDTNLINQKQFIANVSHEIKTPMAIIKGYSEALLETNNIKPEKSVQFLCTITRNIDRIEHIIHTLLYFSKLENSFDSNEIRFEEVMINSIIEDVVAILQQKTQRQNIQFICNCGKATLAKVNRTMIQQAISNLIDNAIIYSDDDKEIIIKSEATCSEFIISIIDHGIGIEEENLDKIFDKFYRVKGGNKLTNGSGLGLSIVKFIAETHNGRVSVTSKPSKGSQFNLHIPI